MAEGQFGISRHSITVCDLVSRASLTLLGSEAGLRDYVILDDIVVFSKRCMTMEYALSTLDNYYLFKRSTQE